MNIGHSSRSSYDNCAYNDRLAESVGPGAYRLNPMQIANCDACLSTMGPRGSYGVSSVVGNSLTPSQDLVDVESVLRNLNTRASKCREGGMNDIDVTRFHQQHARVCNKFLDPISSRLTNPTANFRGTSINRFHYLDRDPQRVIFQPFARNTRLEARDNYRAKIPQYRDGDVSPKPSQKKNSQYPCHMNCGGNCEKCAYPMS